MQLEHRRCSNYIWVINKFIAYKGVTYIRGLTILPEYNQLLVIIDGQPIPCDSPDLCDTGP